MDRLAQPLRSRSRNHRHTYLGRGALNPQEQTSRSRAPRSVTGTEIATSGSGTNATTHSDELAELQTELSGARSLIVRQPIDLRGEIHLPDGSAPSFIATSNTITWRMGLAIAISRWPDWVQTSKLLVVPPVEEWPPRRYLELSTRSPRLARVDHHLGKHHHLVGP
jgi:hypothetical protein